MPMMNENDGMELLLKFIDDISLEPFAWDEEIENESLERYYMQLKRIYSDENFRHLYSSVSRKMEEYNPDVYSALPGLLATILEYAERKLTSVEMQEQKREREQERVCKSIKKLWDHIDLECVRLDRMAAVKQYTERAIHSMNISMDKTKEIEEKWEDINTRVNEAQETAKSFHAQSITILGIFSALVLGVALELNVFSAAVASVSENNLWVKLVTVAFSGVIIFNTIFMLLFSTAKISKSSIAAGKNGNYWYVWAVNFLFIAMAIGILILHWIKMI